MEEDSENQEKKAMFIPKTLRIFMSYSEDDKIIAGGVKDALNKYGIQTFLAHDDIAPGIEWEDEIILNIKKSDIFMTLLSEGFKKSKWTDQETGMAIANSKFIIPVCLDETMPYGFMKRYQAFKKFDVEIREIHGKDTVVCYDDVLKIITFISERIEFKENVKDSLITSLTNVWNFRDAERHFELLLSLGPFSKEQINQILIESAKDSQIYNAHGCQRMINELIKKYKKDLEQENVQKILELIE